MEPALLHPYNQGQLTWSECLGGQLSHWGHSQFSCCSFQCATEPAQHGPLIASCMVAMTPCGDTGPRYEHRPPCCGMTMNVDMALSNNSGTGDIMALAEALATQISMDLSVILSLKEQSKCFIVNNQNCMPHKYFKTFRQYTKTQRQT